MVPHRELGYYILALLLSGTLSRSEISCRDEGGKPVDWFVVYKLPMYKMGDVGSGVEYVYLDSSLGTWQPGRFLVNMSQGAIGSTLAQLYQHEGYKSNSSAYMLYNDGPPELEYLQSYGHTKGVLLFDQSQGLWLTHSIPHFPSFPERGYVYPATGRMFGQNALCVTYKSDQFQQISQQLALLNPRVYNCSLPEVFQTWMSTLHQLCLGSAPPASKKRTETLTSAKGERFISFAKSHLYVDDIYTGWVAQTLKTDLLTETWQHWKGLPSNCSLPKHALNVKRVALPGPALFSSYHDHSKWCVSWDPQDRWTCLGDLNRESGQAWRAGGLVCTPNPVVYKAFRQVVAWYIGC